MCRSHQKQSPQGPSSICDALLGDHAYKKQCPTHGSTKLSFCGAVRLGLTHQTKVVLSDKTSRFHPRHVVLKPTQADEFEMPVRREWISHRPPADRYVGFSIVVGGGRCCRCSRRLVAPNGLETRTRRCPLIDGYCCKSLFASPIANFPGRTSGDRIII